MTVAYFASQLEHPKPERRRDSISCLGFQSIEYAPNRRNISIVVSLHLFFNRCGLASGCPYVLSPGSTVRFYAGSVSQSPDNFRSRVTQAGKKLAGWKTGPDTPPIIYGRQNLSFSFWAGLFHHLGPLMQKTLKTLRRYGYSKTR